jgi:phosphoribosyl 1,2-cyclic phosphate phosphodiesterase
LAVRAAAAAGTATEAAALTPQPQPQAVTLIDSSPDLRIQLVREQIADVARVIYTHEHYDHIGGLAQLEYYSRLKTKRPLPIYAGEETLAIIEQQFGFMADVLKPHRIVAEEQLLFDDVCYTPLPATHSKGAFGFAIAASDGQGPRVAYFPDTATLTPATAERLMGIDILLIDASFNGENWMPTTHHSIDEAIVTAQALRAGRTYLTHLSMHYSTPISSAELAERLAPFGERIQAAFDGLTLTL